MPDPSPRDAPPAAFGQVAERVAVIADGLEAHRDDAQVLQAIREARAVCERLAAAEGSATTQQLLKNLTVVFETWQQVWPRLGVQREFRLAVAREARLWAKRLSGSTS